MMKPMLLGDPKQQQQQGWSEYQSRLDREIAEILKLRTVEQGGSLTDEDKLNRYLGAMYRFMKVSRREGQLPDITHTEAVELERKKQEEEQKIKEDVKKEEKPPKRTLSPDNVLEALLGKKLVEEPQQPSQAVALQPLIPQAAALPPPLIPQMSWEDIQIPQSKRLSFGGREAVSEEEHQYIDKLIGKVVSKLHSETRPKARIFLETMQDELSPLRFHPETLELIVRGETIPGSNMKDLVRYFNKDKAYQPPIHTPGLKEFVEYYPRILNIFKRRREERKQQQGQGLKQKKKCCSMKRLTPYWKQLGLVNY